MLCSIQNKISSPFLSLGYVLKMFLHFGNFQPQVLIKKVHTKKSVHLDEAACNITYEKHYF